MEALNDINGNPIKDRKEVIPSRELTPITVPQTVLHELTMEEAARYRIATSPFRQFKLNFGEEDADN